MRVELRGFLFAMVLLSWGQAFAASHQGALQLQKVGPDPTTFESLTVGLQLEVTVADGQWTLLPEMASVDYSFTSGQERPSCENFSVITVSGGDVVGIQHSGASAVPLGETHIVSIRAVVSETIRFRDDGSPGCQIRVTGSQSESSFPVHLTLDVAGGELRALLTLPGESPAPAGVLTTVAPPPVGGTLRNVNRFGLPGDGLAGATLTLFVGEQTFATATSGADGSYAFEGLEAPGDLYDLRVQLGDAVRVYQAVRPNQLDALGLTLPVDLRSRLNTELGKLENTPPLFLAYNTAQVRTLLASWNTAQPEDATVHAQRDRALGRLLFAAEGLAQLFGSVEPLAQDAAKQTVDTITTVLSMREVVQAAQQALASAVAEAAPGASEAIGRVALQAVVKMLDIFANLLQSALTDGVKATLPPFATELFEDAFGIIAKGVLGTFGSGAWNAAEGRKALLTGVVETLVQEVGGRVIGSGCVAQTQQDLQLAEIRARTLQFDGTQPEAFSASNAVLNASVVRIENTLELTAALGNTGKGWSAVADASVLVGRVPGAQLAAALGAVVKGLSVAQLAGATIADFLALGVVTLDDAPLLANRAFFPTATKTAGWHAPLRWPLPRSKSLPSAYTTALAALRTALVADDPEAALAAAEALLAAEDTLADAIDQRRLRLNAHAANATAGSDDAARLAALERIAVFGVERALLYAQIAGYLLPALADPDTLPADIVAQLDIVSSSGVLADDALAAAEAPVQGSSLPAMLVVERHGLGETSAPLRISPGPFRLHARLRNVGDVEIPAAEVQLSIELGDGSSLTLQLDDPAQQALGPMAAGTTREVVWQGTASLPAERIEGEAVNYRVTPQFSGGRVLAAEGGFVVANEPGEDIFDDGFEPRP